MFTNTDSIRTTIDETEASIMIYDGIITRRIQEAEKNYDTFRKEKSHSRVERLNNSSSNTSFPSDSEDEEAKKRKVEESNEKPEIPEISSRLMRIRLETTEEEIDEADTGDHDDGTEKMEEKDYGADESKLSDNSRKRNAVRTESSITSQRRSPSRGEKSKNTRTKQRLPMIDPNEYWWSGNTAFLEHYLDKWKSLFMSDHYSPDQEVQFVLKCIPNDKRFIIKDCETLGEILSMLSHHKTDGKAYAQKILQEIKNSSKSQSDDDDRKLLQFFSESLENLTKLSGTPVLEYWTALDMIHKFHSKFLKHRCQNELENLATDTTGTHYRVNDNYLVTMQLIITKAVAVLDKELISEKSSVSIKGLCQRSNRESRILPPQGSDQKASRRSDQGQGLPRGLGKGSNCGSGTGQKSNARTHYGPRHARYCRLCKANGHDNLLFCPRLPECVPGEFGAKITPKEVCRLCLSTAPYSRYCRHPFPKNHRDWLCEQSKISIVLCNCKDNDYSEWKHQGPQEWLKRNFNPNIGLSNLYNAWIRFRHSKNNSILINTVQVEEASPTSRLTTLVIL